MDNMTDKQLAAAQITEECYTTGHIKTEIKRAERNDFL